MLSRCCGNKLGFKGIKNRKLHIEMDAKSCCYILSCHINIITHIYVYIYNHIDLYVLLIYC